MNIASELLGIDKEALRNALTTRTTTTRGEKFVTPLTVEQVNNIKKFFILIIIFQNNYIQ